jgi:hypothetical protein
MVSDERLPDWQREDVGGKCQSGREKSKSMAEAKGKSKIVIKIQTGRTSTLEGKANFMKDRDHPP